MGRQQHTRPSYWWHTVRLKRFIKKKYLQLLPVILFVILLFSFFIPTIKSADDPETPEQNPIACFQWNPIDPECNQQIIFDSSCSFDPNGCASSQPSEQTSIDNQNKISNGENGAVVNLPDDGNNDSSPDVGGDQGSQHVMMLDEPENIINGKTSSEQDIPHIESYLWDFGDENTSTEDNPLHQYTKPGEYTVSLTVIDNLGKTNTTVGKVQVDPPAQPLSSASAIIDRITPNPAQQASLVFFQGHGEDPNGPLIGYWWYSDIDGNLSTQPSFTISSLSPGTHLISFKVQNNTGVWSSSDEEILIVNRPPLANSGGPYLGWIDKPIQFDGSASVDLDGTISSYSWSFGDHAVQSGQKPTHTYTQIGIYTITLTVTDNLGGTNTVTTIARIVKNPPHANANGPYFAYPNQTICFNGSHSTDSDGVIIQWHWDFGDGTNSTGKISMHTYRENGTYQVNLSVVDNDGETDRDTTTAIIIENLPPSIPKLNGSSIGGPLTEYTYRAVSEDPEQDCLSYFFDWGDGTSFTSPMFSSGTILVATHQWTVAGNYTIRVCAIDTHNSSSKSSLFIVNIKNIQAYQPTQNSLPNALVNVLGLSSLYFAQTNSVLLIGMLTIMLIGILIFLVLKRIQHF